jgi:hypothetical protein
MPEGFPPFFLVAGIHVIAKATTKTVVTFSWSNRNRCSRGWRFLLSGSLGGLWITLWRKGLWRNRVLVSPRR